MSTRQKKNDAEYLTMYEKGYLHTLLYVNVFHGTIKTCSIEHKQPNN